MRFLLFSVLLICLLLFQRCESYPPLSAMDEEEQGSKLNGSWKQVVSFFSIGDATIHRQPLADTAYQYVQFNKDSTVETNISLLSPYKKYSVLNDSVIQFSGVNVQPVTNQYELSGDTLHLFMTCIEACGGSFVQEAK
jgi:hypothetical protein